MVASVCTIPGHLGEVLFGCVHDSWPLANSRVDERRTHEEFIWEEKLGRGVVCIGNGAKRSEGLNGQSCVQVRVFVCARLPATQFSFPEEGFN